MYHQSYTIHISFTHESTVYGKPFLRGGCTFPIAVLMGKRQTGSQTSSLQSLTTWAANSFLSFICQVAIQTAANQTLALKTGNYNTLFYGNGYFAVNGILPFKTILL